MTYVDHYEASIARHYDAVYAVMRDPSGDAAFYAALARDSGGPVLELGCGTGRILLPIARAGIPCVGLDPSPAMLEVLRSKVPSGSLPNLEIVEARMESFELGAGRFTLITAPFRVLSHLLEVDAQLAMLAAVRRHLAPGGAFAFDLFDPKLERTAVREEPEHVAVTFREAGVELRRWDRVTRDPTRQVMTLRVRFEAMTSGAAASGVPAPTAPAAPDASAGPDAPVAEIQMRWYYRFELEHLLARAGFTALTFYGGFDRRPWAAGGETVVVAR